MRGILDLSDLPEYDGMEDEGFPPLPPPGSPGQGGQEDGEPFADDAGEEAELSKLDEVPAAKRKGVKRPQPKLDSQRLISERGLPALRSLFQDLQFKGKGHEAADLQLLMQKMENWAHRLYPKLQFEDFIEKVEKLGSKKEVQTCLKRIRLDMPLTHEDFTGEEAGLPDLQLSEDLDPFSRLVHSTPAPAEAPPTVAPFAEAPPPPAPPTPPSLTEEQRSRMELNRRRALEKRLARQQLPDSQTVDSSQLQPTSPTAGVLQSTGEGEEGMMEVGQDEKMEEIEEGRNEEEKVLEETTEEEKEKNVEKEIDEEKEVKEDMDEEKVEKEDMDEEKVEMLQEEEEEERNAEEENSDFASPPEEQTVGASPPQQQ